VAKLTSVDIFSREENYSWYEVCSRLGGHWSRDDRVSNLILSVRAVTWNYRGQPRGAYNVKTKVKIKRKMIKVLLS
jgi:hypothetical protein